MAAKDALNGMREMQAYLYPKPTPNATAPDYCLAASRFMVGKLAGLFKRDQHLNMFLDAPDCRRTGLKRSEVSYDWGHITTVGDLNSKILPVAIKWGGQKGDKFRARFEQFWGQESRADTLLAQGVPLVVAVALHGKGGRDHFITLVKQTTGEIWAIDSWGETGPISTVQLPNDFTFTMGEQVAMNGGPQTVIPCAKTFFGYYEELPAKSPLFLTAAL